MRHEFWEPLLWGQTIVNYQYFCLLPFSWQYLGRNLFKQIQRGSVPFARSQGLTQVGRPFLSLAIPPPREGTATLLWIGPVWGLAALRGEKALLLSPAVSIKEGQCSPSKRWQGLRESPLALCTGPSYCILPYYVKSPMPALVKGAGWVTGLRWLYSIPCGPPFPAWVEKGPRKWDHSAGSWQDSWLCMALAPF